MVQASPVWVRVNLMKTTDIGITTITNILWSTIMKKIITLLVVIISCQFLAACVTEKPKARHEIGKIKISAEVLTKEESRRRERSKDVKEKYDKESVRHFR